jgi:ASC-1-like (ASCH) protein
MAESAETSLTKPIQNHPPTPYLDWLKSGVKVYEGRLSTQIKKWNLFVGKKITFVDQDDDKSYIICEIIDLPEFKDFATAFDALGNKLIPGKTKNEVIDMYNKLFHNKDEIIVTGITSKMISDVGVVAIGLKILYMQ